MKINFKPLIPILVLLLNLSSCQKNDVFLDEKKTCITANDSMSTAGTGLTLDEANKTIARAVSDERTNSKNSLKSGWDNKSFSYKRKMLKFITSAYGDKPAGRRSLYISMHNGSATTASLDDKQWNNHVSRTSDNSSAVWKKGELKVLMKAKKLSLNIHRWSRCSKLFYKRLFLSVLVRLFW